MTEQNYYKESNRSNENNVVNQKHAYGYVYITTNNVNGKKYIGQKKYTKNHEYYLGSGKILIEAIKKYGRQSFTKEIIEECYSKEELSIRERYWIKEHDAVNNSMFYNITDGGTGGGLSHDRMNNEDRSRIKEKLSKRSTGSNNPMYGKHHSEETKRNISRLHKIRYSIKENNPNYGKLGEKNSLSHTIYCKETGIVYHGIRQASRETGIPSPNIIKSLKSNGRLSAGKHLGKRMHWYYVSQNNSIKEDKDENSECKI